jgi:hypothetical protein
VPLASTAVGVVEPARAGMASGINTTFRQVGIATGIASLGALFVAHVRDGVESALLGTPLADVGHRIAEQVSGGQAAQAIASAPAPLRSTVAEASRAAFVSSLNDILLVGAVIAFVAAVAALSLIRQRDFVLDPSVGAAAPAPA